MVKRILFIFLLVLLFTLTSCGDVSTNQNDKTPLEGTDEYYLINGNVVIPSFSNSNNSGSKAIDMDSSNWTEEELFYKAWIFPPFVGFELAPYSEIKDAYLSKTAVTFSIMDHFYDAYITRDSKNNYIFTILDVDEGLFLRIAVSQDLKSFSYKQAMLFHLTNYEDSYCYCIAYGEDLSIEKLAIDGKIRVYGNHFEIGDNSNIEKELVDVEHASFFDAVSSEVSTYDGYIIGGTVYYYSKDSISSSVVYSFRVFEPTIEEAKELSFNVSDVDETITNLDSIAVEVPSNEVEVAIYDRDNDVLTLPGRMTYDAAIDYLHSLFPDKTFSFAK